MMKAYNTEKAEIGDVIVGSKEFTFGRLGGNIEDVIKQIETKSPTVIVDLGVSSGLHEVQATKTIKRKISGQEFTRDEKVIYHLARHDKTREGALYVVEHVLPVREDMRSFQRVFARRLLGDGSYNVSGESVAFYQGGFYNSNIPIVKVVGKMQIAFTPLKLAKGYQRVMSEAEYDAHSGRSFECAGTDPGA